MAIVFERNGVTVHQVMALVTREISTCLQEATLFRSNSFATKLFKTYSKLVCRDCCCCYYYCCHCFFIVLSLFCHCCSDIIVFSLLCSIRGEGE